MRTAQTRAVLFLEKQPSSSSESVIMKLTEEKG